MKLYKYSFFAFVFSIFFTVSVYSNEVNHWNDVTLSAIRTARLTPPFSSRVLAIVHGAMFDAVNSIKNKYEPYMVSLKADLDFSEELAVAAAARTVLEELLPLQRYFFKHEFELTYGKYAHHPKAAVSLNLGVEVAKVLLAARSADSKYMSADLNYVAESKRGHWIPTFPTYENPLTPFWGEMKPFVLTSGSQFRLSPPPSLESQEYQEALKEVKNLGAKNSSLRTIEQAEIAKFWADGSGTNTPPGHYNVMARTIAQNKNFDLVQTAHMLALLNFAMADAAISCWDMKYAYWFWRPLTAIRETKMDMVWEPLLFTPYFPEYVSGHSTFSGAAQVILTHVFASDEVSFVIPSDGLPGVTRSYKKISEATKEAGRSRIYGGIHFEFSNQKGQELGLLVGNYILANTLKTKN